MLDHHDRRRELRWQTGHQLRQRRHAAQRRREHHRVEGAASALQERGLISYRRGILTVLDRNGLLAASCACYQIIRDEFDRLVQP